MTTTTTCTENFFQKLERRISTCHSHLCIGLDPHPGIDILPSDENPYDAAYTFCKTIIDATSPHAAAFKPNAAFFESLGPRGLETLQRVIKLIPSDIPILLDNKRGDIGSTATAYAHASYQIGADAVTLSPLMGWDSVSPFVTGSYASKGAFLLCKTSNPGSEDLQTLPIQTTGRPLYHHIAKLATQWSSQHNAPLGLVVGATDPKAVKNIRCAAPNIWILAPGIGAQGGPLEEVCRVGRNAEGSGILFPVSRGVSRSEDPQKAAEALKESIQIALKSPPTPGNKEEILAPHQKEFLTMVIQRGILKFGSFVLKSGRTSPYFFNAGLFCMGDDMAQLAAFYARTIVNSSSLMNDDQAPKFDVLFGPAYKGIALGAIVAMALYTNHGINVGFTYNRKEAKSHGEGGKLVGAPMEGKRILIIDDVITAGTAIRESHTMLTQINGAEIVGVVIALDRAEKRALDDPLSAVQAVQRDLSIDVISVVGLQELQIYLDQQDEQDEKIKSDVREYREKYGV